MGSVLVGVIARSIIAISCLMRQRGAALALSLLVGIGGMPVAQSVIATESVPQVYDAGGRAKPLTHEALREIFFMRLTVWPDGTPIRVFVLPENHPLHVRFAKEVLGVYPFQLRDAWNRLVFSGTGMAPTLVETVEEMRERVRLTPGGIGYVDR